MAVDGDTAVVAVALPLPATNRAQAVHGVVAEAVLAATDAQRVEVDLREMTDDEKQVAARVLKGQVPAKPANPLAVVDAHAAHRPPPRATRSPTPHPRARDRVGQGRRRQVVGHDEPRGRARAARPPCRRASTPTCGASRCRACSASTDPPGVIDDVIVPPEANGVTLISMGFFAREDQPVIWRGPMLHKALEQFLTDVHWGDPDFLVVDMPPGTGDIALSMAQFLPRAEVVIVTTPQPAAQRVAQRAAAMAREGQPRR